MSEIIENDVRLMRRLLVCLRVNDLESAKVITSYLRNTRKLNFILPDEQTEELRDSYLGRLLDNEKWLARKYGCVLLPDYNDCIFLNSRWANPFTLYMHLNAPIDELGELGKVYWCPEEHLDKWKSLSQANHEAYQRYVDSIAPAEKGFFARLFGK